MEPVRTDPAPEIESSVGYVEKLISCSSDQQGEPAGKCQSVCTANCMQLSSAFQISHLSEFFGEAL